MKKGKPKRKTPAKKGRGATRTAKSAKGYIGETEKNL
jgi:hypothetical protein